MGTALGLALHEALVTTERDAGGIRASAVDRKVHGPAPFYWERRLAVTTNPSTGKPRSVRKVAGVKFKIEKPM